MNKENKTKAGKEAVSNIGLVKDLMYSGGVYRGEGGKFISKQEAEKSNKSAEFYQTITKSPLSIQGLDKVAKSMRLIANTLTSINKTIAEKMSKSAYQAEEAALEARPEDAKKVEKDEGGLKSDLADLFKNPAFLAALAGIVYAVLPEDVQKKFGALFGGFTDGIEKGSEGFGKLSSTVKLAGAGIALFIGGKFIKNIVDMTTSMISIGKRIGKMGKVGKAAAVLTAGAVAVDYATDKEEAPEATSTGGAPSTSAAPEPAAATPPKENKPESKQKPVPEKKAEPATTPSAPPKSKSNALPESKPRTSDTGESSTGTGITPGAKIGFKPTGGTGFKDVKNMIKFHEGVRNRPYKDSLGLWTVGVGHLIGDGKSLPPEYDRTFSDEEINALFEKDFEHHQKAAEKIPGYNKMSDKGKGALIDLTFNMGPAWYKKWPNFTSQLAEGNTEAAADNLQNSKWFGQVGRRGPTIVSMIRDGGSEGGVQDEGAAVPVAAPAATGGGLSSIEESRRKMNAPYEYKPSAGSQELQSKIAELQKSQGISDAELMAQIEKNEGKAVADMTREVRTKTAAAKAIPPMVNNINASTQKEVGGGTQYEAPPPIPSPVASRGSLAAGTTHYSAA